MSRSDRTFALMPYPLSQGFRTDLEEVLGVTPEYLSVPQLRRLGPRGLLGALARMRGGRVVLPLEDPSSESMLPLLHGLAAAALPAAIEVVHADLRRERLRRGAVVAEAVGLARASLDGVRARRAASARLADLLRAERIEAAPGPGNRVVSLNANLWFGVKAGGSLAHTGGVANGLAAAGYDVDLVAPFRVPHLRPGVVEHPTAPPAAFALPSEANYVRHDDALFAELTQRLRAAPLRFVYQRLSIHSHAGVRLSRTLGVPLVVEYNGSEVWVARHWGHALRYEQLAEQAEEALLRHAHVVVTVSEVLRDELLERGIEERRVVMYPNCVDTAVFDPARFTAADRSRLRASLGIADDALVATFVGTFGRWHGTDVLARTIRSLAAEAEDWLAERRLHFLLVGDGLRLPEVEDILGGRRGRFHTLAGLVPQADTPAYLHASDLLLSPHVPNTDGTRFFGSPTKLFEYMAMGKPIVASALDQIGDVLQPAVHASALPTTGASPDDEVAIAAEPRNEAELAAGIRFLVERKPWRAALGANARRLATERYTWEAHVAAVLRRLDELTD